MVNNDKLENSNGDGRTDGIDKIFVKAKKHQKIVKGQKIYKGQTFEIIYSFRLQS